MVESSRNIRRLLVLELMRLSAPLTYTVKLTEKCQSSPSGTLTDFSSTLHSPAPVFRDVDRRAIREGYRVLPPRLGAMRMLMIRAWRLYEMLSSNGVKVIETHPYSALKSSDEKKRGSTFK
ncbi:hypothetical protein KEJ34_03685 [Candidatus Bathyarchaeota archaeon]|nr:hypothetical protein [Candidatus Bathyarchaeota archaeon]